MEELTAELKDILQISEFPRFTIVDESNKVDNDDDNDDQDIQKQPSGRQESFLPDSTLCITVPENKDDTSHHPIDRNDLILPDWDPTEDDWILSILAVDESEQELSSHDISIDESPLTYSLLPVVSLPTIGSDTWDTSSWEANSIQIDEPWNFSLDENPNDIFLDINDYDNIFDSSELDTDYPQQHINNNNNILDTLEYSLSRLTMIESSNSIEAQSSQYIKDNKDFEAKEEEGQSSPEVLVPDSDLLLPWPEDYNQYNAFPLEDLANFFTGTEYDKNSLDQQDSPFEQSSQPYQADQEPPDENLMNEFYGTDYDYYTAKELPSGLPAFMCCQPCQPGQEEIVNRGNPDQNWNPFLTPSSHSSDTALFYHPSFPDMELHGSSPFVKNYTNNKDEEKELSSSSPLGPQSNSLAGRRRAIQSALPYTVSFASGIHQPISEGKQQRPNERVCLGHKEVIFGLEFSPCGNYMATASQDSTIRIWDVHHHRLLQALTAHDTAYECLRVAWYVHYGKRLSCIFFSLMNG
jgi:WD40 repeat protein